MAKNWTESELRKLAQENPDLKIEGLEEPDEEMYQEFDSALSRAVGRDVGIGPTFRSLTEMRAWKEWVPTVPHINAWYEPIRFNLPSGGYTPDLAILTKEREFWFIEIKGSWSAYSSGRAQKKSLKEAATIYKQWGRFFSLIWDKDQKEWVLKEYTEE